MIERSIYGFQLNRLHFIWKMVGPHYPRWVSDSRPTRLFMTDDEFSIRLT